MTQTGMAESGEFTLLTVAPGEFYREFIFGAAQIVEACNASSCWNENGAGNLYTLFGAEAKREQATGKYLNFALPNYKKLKIRVRFVGIENVNGRPAEVVEMQIPPGETRRVYFDRGTRLIVKEVIESAKTEPAETQSAEGKPAGSMSKINATASMGVEEEITYSDYRSVQGIMEPFRWTIQQGAETFQVSIDRVAFNVDMKASSFDFPNLSKKPLPDIAALLTAVDKNQKKIDEIQQDYACMKLEEEDKVNGKGEVPSERRRSIRSHT